MTSLSALAGKDLISWIGVGVLCLGLVGCRIPRQFSRVPADTARSTLTLRLSEASRLTSVPTSLTQVMAATTASPPVTPGREPGGSLAGFEGCWGLDTEDVSFQIRLKRQDRAMEGSFLLVRFCVVANQVSACRIREGTIQGISVTHEVLELLLAVPEYDDQGVAQVRLAGDGAALQWQELDYPTRGLADGEEHYLPPSFVLIPCGA